VRNRSGIYTQAPLAFDGPRPGEEADFENRWDHEGFRLLMLFSDQDKQAVIAGFNACGSS